VRRIAARLIDFVALGVALRSVLGRFPISSRLPAGNPFSLVETAGPWVEDFYCL
jgi:hypothetical protein